MACVDWVKTLKLSLMSDNNDSISNGGTKIGRRSYTPTNRAIYKTDRDDRVVSKRNVGLFFGKSGRRRGEVLQTDGPILL